jgi:hypothetical protein
LNRKTRDELLQTLLVDALQPANSFEDRLHRFLSMGCLSLPPGAATLFEAESRGLRRVHLPAAWWNACTFRHVVVKRLPTGFQPTPAALAKLIGQTL